MIFQDSRSDPSYSPDRPPGNTAAGTSSGPVVDAIVARSSNGTTWTETVASAARSNPNFENRGNARSPFFGDYNYVSAAPDGSFFTVWTDTRDLVSFTDPRDGNQDEGFDADTRTCNWVPDDIFAAAYSSPAGVGPVPLAGRPRPEHLRHGRLTTAQDPRRHVACIARAAARPLRRPGAAPRRGGLARGGASIDSLSETTGALGRVVVLAHKPCVTNGSSMRHPKPHREGASSSTRVAWRAPRGLEVAR